MSSRSGGRSKGHDGQHGTLALDHPCPDSLTPIDRFPHPRRKPPLSAQPPLSFQDLILTLQHYWSERGCVVLQPYDLEMGDGTFHPATRLRASGPDPGKEIGRASSREK